MEVIYIQEECNHKLNWPGYDPPVDQQTKCVKCGAMFTLAWVKQGIKIPKVSEIYSTSEIP